MVALVKMVDEVAQVEQVCGPEYFRPVGHVSIGSDVFDVYGSEAGAATYMAARLGADDWDDASATDKKKAMVSATRWIDRARWQGAQTDGDTPQPLAFPRTGLTDCDGNAVADTWTPDAAAYELALVLLGDASVPESVDSGSNIKKLKAGPAELEYFKGTTGRVSRFPTIAHELLRCFLEGAGGIGGAWASDTVAESAFDDDDRYDYGRGLP